VTATDDRASLERLSVTLRELYAHVLAAERELNPPTEGLALLDRLLNDPAWAWLRPLSALIADIDHVTALPESPGATERTAAAAHLRGLLFGEGELVDRQFLDHYRPLLQLHPAIASTHGELRRLLRDFPAESDNESERLHARHQWAMRCQHRRHAG
jgi:hypothetical protein